MKIVASASALGLGLAALLSACASQTKTMEPASSSEQSFCDAMTLVCEVDARAGLDSREDPLDVAQKRHDWIGDKVKNPDAIYLTTLWRVQPAEQRAKSIRKHALDAGIESCPLADSLERDGEL